METKQIDNLTELRNKIDEIDSKLLNLLAQRMELSGAVGALKRKHNIEALQPERYSSMMDDRLEQAKQLHLNREFIVELFDVIHRESVASQK
ncbi:MAG: chorismate mutase [bacterium]